MDFRLSRMKRPASDKRTMSRSLCLRQDILRKELAIAQQAGMRGSIQRAIHTLIFSPFQRNEPNGMGSWVLALLQRMFTVLLFFIKFNYVWGYPLYIGEVTSQFPGKCSVVKFPLKFNGKRSSNAYRSKPGRIDTATSVISALRRPVMSSRPALTTDISEE